MYIVTIYTEAFDNFFIYDDKYPSPFGRRIFFYIFRLITKPLVWAAASYKIYWVGRKCEGGGYEVDWRFFGGFGVKIGV